MRIIGGTYKGKSIHPPKQLKARPTTDYAREGLFNVIGNEFTFEGLAVADLFSGTGSISYEFASRGAARIEAVEKNRTHTRFIHKTIRELSMGRMTVYPTDIRIYLEKATGPFDIIFADPPYDLEWLPEIPGLVLSRDLLQPEGWFILEHSRKNDFRAAPGFRDVRKYGNVHFSIFSPR